MSMLAIHQNRLVFTFGLLGNLISFLVYIAPTPTFVRIYRKKSTEEFQSLPYVVALFSAMLWIYYALLKTDAYYLITINSIGCVIETIYIVMYLVYAPRRTRIMTAKLLLLLNLGVFCLILILSQYLAKGQKRVGLVGWVCVAFSLSVFVAPLSIVRLVIRTRSVEYMPFTLSFFLTLCAVMWFLYGFLVRDLFIAMVLYLIYKDWNKKVKAMEEQKMEEQIIDVIRLSMMRCSEAVHPVDPQDEPITEDNILWNLQEEINGGVSIVAICGCTVKCNAMGILRLPEARSLPSYRKIGYTQQECPVHAVQFITLSDSQRNNVVLLRCSSERLARCFQMMLYVMYKDSNKIKEEQKQKQQEHEMSDVNKLSTTGGCSEPLEMDAKSIHEKDKVGDDENKPLDDQFERREEYKIQIAIPIEPLEMDAKFIHEEDNVDDDQNKPLDDQFDRMEKYKIQIGIPTEAQLIECGA
ncbi:hypothetical protein NE237_007770 [Protea cynaroides]|uniref:Bidirectional sugar transporter SWEET n=1 Tax=Protea cynaroides TaxID=273540 RepID=A0A9Q0KQP5_9MAGN|nr:hypothetical protein NE237_007770 [Protea cynaroides]